MEKLGIYAEKRTEPLPEVEALSPSELALEQYEAGRPSEIEACRKGDDRVLADKAVKFDPKPSIIDQPLRVDVDHRGQY